MKHSINELPRFLYNVKLAPMLSTLSGGQDPKSPMFKYLKNIMHDGLASQLALASWYVSKRFPGVTQLQYLFL